MTPIDAFCVAYGNGFEKRSDGSERVGMQRHTQPKILRLPWHRPRALKAIICRGPSRAVENGTPEHSTRHTAIASRFGGQH
jgi:hypothetical protein